MRTLILKCFLFKLDLGLDFSCFGCCNTCIFFDHYCFALGVYLELLVEDEYPPHCKVLWIIQWVFLQACPLFSYIYIYPYCHQLSPASLFLLHTYSMILPPRYVTKEFFLVKYIPFFLLCVAKMLPFWSCLPFLCS